MIDMKNFANGDVATGVAGVDASGGLAAVVARLRQRTVAPTGVPFVQRSGEQSPR
ncbi:hypothetical protein [Nakamurella endophytica]|uniref:Uncharacterized protein n=1 Tax=Nakamurella endophytica TaxID=1748367 RepID=A0A917T3E6_9ACTN|nr:hypothetical protein [Nakamurella endophytica]GGM07925.1 hypothetical protein GCM10011594_29900 [Nakamurella endophytica]